MINSKMKNHREVIVEIVMAVFEDNKLSHLVIRDTLKECEFPDKKDKAFVNRAAEGTIERKITIDYIINQFSKVKVNKMKPLIRNVLRTAVYQIVYMENVPDSAACNEAVKIAKKRGFANLSGFVNGVLRNISRNKENIVFPDSKSGKAKCLSVKYSVPEWIIESFIEDYGDKQTMDILSNLYPEKDKGICVRVNISKTNIETVIKGLSSKGIEVKVSKFADSALILNNCGNISEIEEFRQGLIQVQDISSMLVGQICGVREGDICIDMCAAPGGKSIHLADLLKGTGHIYSRDVSDRKITLIKDNMQRSGMKNISAEICDATEFRVEDEGKADIVIADVPCSGMGILRKKTDIKYKISKENVKELAILSQKILINGVKYLKSGGTLVFSTCTMNRLENDEIRKWLMENFELVPKSFTDCLSNDILSIGENRSTSEKGYLQLFMTEDYDGFFISKFIRK